MTDDNDPRYCDICGEYCAGEECCPICRYNPTDNDDDWRIWCAARGYCYLCGENVTGTYCPRCDRAPAPERQP